MSVIQRTDNFSTLGYKAKTVGQLVDTADGVSKSAGASALAQPILGQIGYAAVQHPATAYRRSTPSMYMVPEAGAAQEDSASSVRPEPSVHSQDHWGEPTDIGKGARKGKPFHLQQRLCFGLFPA